MKKVLIGIGLALAVLIVVGYLFRGPLFMMAMRMSIAPDAPFDAATAPSAPDYAKDSSWAALPGTDDAGDQQPEGVTTTPTGVAVFFVHPTSYLSDAGWNQPLDDKPANWLVDERILRHQASVFNSCCEVYAPRYRQATIFSFIDQGNPSAAQALDLAYQDVERAFEAFMQRIDPGQPFILAGHSQGTRHAALLLRDHIVPRGLLPHMVVAYLVGFAVTEDQLGDVPVCASANATGCAVGWNAIDSEGDGAFADTAGLVCVNPLNWSTDGSYAAHELNTGAIGYPSYGPPEDGERVDAMNLEPGAADAQCEDGNLYVKDLRSDSFPSRMVDNSMHVYDYSLFHMNVRTNVALRIAAFRA